MDFFDLWLYKAFTAEKSILEYISRTGIKISEIRLLLRRTNYAWLLMLVVK